MNKTMQVDLVTPERPVLSVAAHEVVLPGWEGSFGVLPGHMPLVAALKPGLLKIRQGDEETLYAIGGGYAEIAPDKTLILAETSEVADQIDVEAARHKRQQALAQLKKGVRGTDLNAVEISLQKALARLNAVETARQRKNRKP